MKQTKQSNTGFLFMLLLIFAACTSTQEKQTAELPPAFKQIQNNILDADSLYKLTQNLDTGYHEEKKFWLDIIHNKKYSIFHRKLAAVKLIQRHVKPGMQLNEFPNVFLSSDTAFLGQYFIWQVDTFALRRKVIRGGSWKNIAYYLQTSARSYDTLYPGFEQKMLRAGYKLFCIDLNQYVYMNSRNKADRYQLLIYIAVQGDIDEEQFAEFLRARKNKKAGKAIIKGIYPVMHHTPVSYLGRGGDDDL